MSVSLRAALTLVILATATTGASAQTVFKYRFKAGETLQYDLTITNKGTTRAGENVISGTQQQVIRMSWLVDSIDDKGAAKLKVAFDRVKLVDENPTATLEVSSDDKDVSDKEAAKGVMLTMARAMSKVVGIVTMSPRGDILNVSMPDSVGKAMRAVPGADKIKVDNYNEGNLHATLKDATFAFPSEALTKGKSWSVKVDGQSPFGKLLGDVTFVYAGPVERDGRTVEQFDVKPKLKIEPDPKGKPPITIKSYEPQGTVYFDNAAGKLVETIAVQSIEVQTEVQGKLFSQKTEVRTTLKLVK